MDLGQALAEIGAKPTNMRWSYSDRATGYSAKCALPESATISAFVDDDVADQVVATMCDVVQTTKKSGDSGKSRTAEFTGKDVIVALGKAQTGQVRQELVDPRLREAVRLSLFQRFAIESQEASAKRAELMSEASRVADEVADEIEA